MARWEFKALTVAQAFKSHWPSVWSHRLCVLHLVELSVFKVQKKRSPSVTSYYNVHFCFEPVTPPTQTNLLSWPYGLIGWNHDKQWSCCRNWHLSVDCRTSESQSRLSRHGVSDMGSVSVLEGFSVDRAGRACRQSEIRHCRDTVDCRLWLPCGNQ